MNNSVTGSTINYALQRLANGGMSTYGSSDYKE